MTIANRVGMHLRHWSVAAPKSCLFTPTMRPATRMSQRPSSSTTIMSYLQHGSGTQQFRSMATVQTTTDVASASYHFKQQKHLPYFLEYLMWVVFGSECLHLIWLKAEYKEYKEHAQHKIALFNDLIALLESNSPVPETLREEIRMVMLNAKSNKHTHQDTEIEDDYLEKLIAASEEADRIKATQPTTTAPTTFSESANNHTKTDVTGDMEIKKQKFII